MKQAGIYVNDVFCGILTEDEEGFHFSYDEMYLDDKDAVPVSPTMPLTKEQYNKEMMFPVFDGLIPEGWLFLDDGQFRYALQELFPDRHRKVRIRSVTRIRFAGSTAGRPCRL